jgi:O-antigen/teichoic acid export membrane protein
MSGNTSDISRLLSSSVIVFAGMLLGSVSKLIERIVIARWTSVDAYGEISIGLSILSFSVAIALLGFNQGIPRYVPRFESEADIRGVWISGLAIAGALAVVLAGAILLNLELLLGLVFENTESRQLLLLFVACIPFLVGLRIGVGMLRGFENTLYRTYSRDLLYNLLRLGALVALLQLGFDILAAGYAYLIATVVTFLAVHLLLNRLMSLTGDVTFHVRKLMAFSTPLVLSTLISVLLMQTDTIMLGFFRGSEEVGLYGAAFPLAQGIPVVLGAFGYLYYPLASRLDVNDEHAEIDSVYKLTTKWGFILMFPLFLTFLMFPEDVLSIVFRPRYSEASLALSILAFGFFTRGAFGRNGDTLSAVGYPRYVLYSSLAAYVLNLVLNLIFIPIYGFVGGAVTSAAASVMMNVIRYVILGVKFNISPFSKWTVRTYVVLPCLLIPAAFVLSQFVTLTVVTLPLFLVATAIVITVLVVVTGCLQPEDHIALQLVESKLGLQVPFVREYLPTVDQ